MSTYVISDIHGHFKEFQDMLKIIEFSDDDELIIAGDIIDRGPYSIEMIRFVQSHPDNVFMLLGNHELMMLDYYVTRSKYNKSIWYSNGGKSTHSQIENYTEEQITELIDWLDSLPIRISVEINGINYSICHADPFAKHFADVVWNRIYPCDPIPDVDEKTIHIIGHAPVTNFTDDDEVAGMIKNYNDKIWYIDGGAAYPMYKDSRLICLRLDDLKEFKIKVNSYEQQEV